MHELEKNKKKLTFKSPLTCSHCGFVPFEAIMSYYNESENHEFSGGIKGVCSFCSCEENVIHTENEEMPVLRKVVNVCECGNNFFYILELKKKHPDHLEHLIMGKCANCGMNSVLAYFNE